MIAPYPSVPAANTGSYTSLYQPVIISWFTPSSPSLTSAFHGCFPCPSSLFLRKTVPSIVGVEKVILSPFLVVTKVIGIMVLALFIAVALTQLKIKEAPFYRIVFFFPNIMSIVVIGILWTFIYNPSMGLVNSGLEFLGLESLARPWLGSETWALPSLVLPSIWAGIGLFMLILMGAISNISKSYYEAAEIDGASEWQQFWKVTLPLIWPQIKISILYIVITTLNGSFIIVQVMTGGGPNNSTHVMGSYLYQQAFVQYNFGYGATIGVMILILSLITVLILQFLMRSEKTEY